MDDPAHLHRLTLLADTVRNRYPPNSFLRVHKSRSHTPYKKLSQYGPTVSSTTTTASSPGTAYTHLSLDDFNHILGMMNVVPTNDSSVPPSFVVPDPSFSLSSSSSVLPTVTVEANVTMHQLCAYLLPYGYLPALPVEGEDFTVAGLLNGFGIQSASHRVGLFHDTVTALQILLANGDVILATPDNVHRDIFWTLPGSFGTLGIVVTVTLRLRSARSRVCTRITRYSTVDTFVRGMGYALRGFDPAKYPGETVRMEKEMEEEMNGGKDRDKEGMGWNKDRDCNDMTATASLIKKEGNYKNSTAATTSLIKEGSTAAASLIKEEGNYKNSTAATTSLIKEGSTAAASFIEGYVFSSVCFVVVETEFIDLSVTVSSLNRLRDPEQFDVTRYPVYDPSVQPGLLYYYQYLREAVQTTSVHYFTLSTMDYLFRHTRGLWWGLENYIGIPFLTGTQIGRKWLDNALASSRRDGKTSDGWEEKPGIPFTHADYARCLVTQGFYTAEERLVTMLEAVQNKLDMYPIWVCPLRVYGRREVGEGEGEGEGEGKKNGESFAVPREYHGLSPFSAVEEEKGRNYSGSTTGEGRRNSGSIPGVSPRREYHDSFSSSFLSSSSTSSSSFLSPSSLPYHRTHGRLWCRITGSSPSYYAFDVGVYGTPRSPTYKCFTTVRELQSIADSPTQWGLSYVTKEELLRENERSILDISLYHRIRKRYGADQGFPLLWEKIKLYRPGIDTDGGVIRCWRWKRDGLLRERKKEKGEEGKPKIEIILTTVAVVVVILAVVIGGWY